jgi:hypothetical protein
MAEQDRTIPALPLQTLNVEEITQEVLRIERECLLATANEIYARRKGSAQ